MPSWAWVVTYCTNVGLFTFSCFNALTGLSCYDQYAYLYGAKGQFQCPHGLELLRRRRKWHIQTLLRFNALSGLSCYANKKWMNAESVAVSMPSRAWVVTARMSNILNFSWYFLCIPAIYRCILAHLPIFFNQLSKFLRCEFPSTFLGTCLSHHSFIIFLVTNTNVLLSAYTSFLLCFGVQ